MTCNLARQDGSAAAGVFFFFLPLCYECDDISAAHVAFCVDVVVWIIVSPLSFFSKKAHSLLALFSGVFSSSGSLLCSSLGISLNMACEPEESLLLAQEMLHTALQDKTLEIYKCRLRPLVSHNSAFGKLGFIGKHIIDLLVHTASHWTLYTT